MGASKPKSTNTQQGSGNSKRVEQPSVSTERSKQVWIFDSVDRNGRFGFVPSRKEMKCNDILEKIIHFSMKSWSEIMAERHNSKSKHHFLSYESLSKEARERVAALHLDDHSDDDKEDRIFSMRLDGKTRILGLRDGEKFIVKWFDPNHEFAPSSDK